MKKCQSFILSVLILSSSALPLFAYYHPDEGRWLNRDPISERGGINIYCFVFNSAIDWVDPVGLIEVSHNHPDASSLKPIPKSKDFFAGKSFGGGAAGWTKYKNRKFNCQCNCNDNGQYILTCTAEWDAEIYLLNTLDKEAAWDAEKISWDGALGHEQKHVDGATVSIEEGIVEEMESLEGTFDSGNDCKNKAKEYEFRYGALLRKLTDRYTEKHSGRKDTDPLHHAHPKRGQPYKPLETKEKYSDEKK